MRSCPMKELLVASKMAWKTIMRDPSCRNGLNSGLSSTVVAITVEPE
jgi:hypothetical protein